MKPFIRVHARATAQKNQVDVLRHFLLVLIVALIANCPTSHVLRPRRHAADTHNFESYPDSDEMPPAVRLEQDPFVDF